MNHLILVTLLLHASGLATMNEAQGGTCQLKEGSPFDPGAVTVQVGQQVKGTCKFCIQKFFGRKIINANITVTNKADKPRHCHYYVAFFDKEGRLLGCTGQGTMGKEGLAAGKTEQFGSCLIPLPIGLHEAAVQYKVAFYESDEEIGTGNATGRAPAMLPRRWTDSTGTHTVEAELVDVVGTTVHLRKGDGQIVTLPVERLSAADQRYLGHREPMRMPTSAVLGESYEGSCRLKAGGMFDRDTFDVPIGQSLKGICKLCITEFAGRKPIHAGAEVANTTDKAIYCKLYVAFFDRDEKFLGCGTLGSLNGKGLAPRKPYWIGGVCLVFLPAGLHEAAVRYKMAFYESDQQIGSDEPRPGEPANARHPSVSTARHDRGHTSAPQPDHSGKHSGEAVSQEAEQPEKLPQGPWFAVGPGAHELDSHAGSHGLSTYSHSPESYQRLLAKSTPDSTIILLFSHDQPNKVIPEQYQDLLPLPWSQIQAAISHSETVQRKGTARGRTIVVLAAPTQPKLRELIHDTTLLSP